MGLFNLGMATSQGERNLWIQASCTLHKNYIKSCLWWRCCIFNPIRTSEDTSLEKYTSHFFWKGSKGLLRFYCVRGELETEQNCSILTLTLMAITALLSCSPRLLNQGPGDPASLGNGPHAHSIQHVDSQGYPLDTFDRMHLLFTQVHFLFWQLGRGQYATEGLGHCCWYCCSNSGGVCVSLYANALEKAWPLLFYF